MIRGSRRFRPSPATVIASIALLVALSGTSYATVLQVPRNSVGTLQLRNNAVTSVKVRNGSLMRSDFRRGQIPAGPAGPTGPVGPTGPAGATGGTGPAGPSDAFARALIGPFALTTAFRTLATLAIPQAGGYVVWAKTELSSEGVSGSVTCLLVAGNEQIDESSSLVSPSRFSGLTLVAVREFATPASVDFRCFGGTGVSALHVRVVAVRVANLTVT